MGRRSVAWHCRNVCTEATSFCPPPHRSSPEERAEEEGSDAIEDSSADDEEDTRPATRPVAKPITKRSVPKKTVPKKATGNATTWDRYRRQQSHEPASRPPRREAARRASAAVRERSDDDDEFLDDDDEEEGKGRHGSRACSKARPLPSRPQRQAARRPAIVEVSEEGEEEEEVEEEVSDASDEVEEGDGSDDSPISLCDDEDDADDCDQRNESDRRPGKRSEKRGGEALQPARCSRRHAVGGDGGDDGDAMEREQVEEEAAAEEDEAAALLDERRKALERRLKRAVIERFLRCDADSGQYVVKYKGLSYRTLGRLTEQQVWSVAGPRLLPPPMLVSPRASQGTHFLCCCLPSAPQSHRALPAGRAAGQGPAAPQLRAARGERRGGRGLDGGRQDHRQAQRQGHGERGFLVCEG